MKWHILKRKLSSLSIIVLTTFSLNILSFGAEQPIPEINQWAIPTLNEGEKYGTFPSDWYYSEFQSPISQQRMDELLTGVDTKLSTLGLTKKSPETTTSSSNTFGTRAYVVDELFNILTKYDISFVNGQTATDFFTKENLLVGTHEGLQLDTLCTTEQATVLATRMIHFVYNQLDAGSKGFVWQVADENNTVYLLGSIHMGTPDMYPINKALKSAFDTSDVLVVESNTFAVNDQLNDFIQLATYNDGTTVKEHISQETYQKLEKALVKLGLPQEQMTRFKPWSIANDLNVIHMSASQTVEGGQKAAAHGVDMYFITSAYVTGKPIVELEGLLYQGHLFNNLSADYQEAYLNATLDGILSPTEEVSEEDQLLATWMNQWIAGDIDNFKPSYNDIFSVNEKDELSQMLFGVRDQAMSEKIIGLLQDTENKDFFVVVGAGHLSLDDTILTHLTNDGYTVERFEY